MIRLDRLNRILILDLRMRIYSVQWAVGLEEEGGSNPIHKISNRYLRIFLVVISMEEEVEEVVDSQALMNCLKISDYYAKSILMNQ